MKSVCYSIDDSIAGVSDIVLGNKKAALVSASRAAKIRGNRLDEQGREAIASVSKCESASKGAASLLIDELFAMNMGKANVSPLPECPENQWARNIHAKIAESFQSLREVSKGSVSQSTMATVIQAVGVEEIVSAAYVKLGAAAKEQIDSNGFDLNSLRRDYAQAASDGRGQDILDHINGEGKELASALKGLDGAVQEVIGEINAGDRPDPFSDATGKMAGVSHVIRELDLNLSVEDMGEISVLQEVAANDRSMGRIAELLGQMVGFSEIARRGVGKRGVGIRGFRSGDLSMNTTSLEMAKLGDSGVMGLEAISRAQRGALQCYKRNTRHSKKRGPIVVCVDASGSMDGVAFKASADMFYKDKERTFEERETATALCTNLDWAKAYCLLLIKIASEGNRAVKIIPYDSDIHHQWVVDLPRNATAVQRLNAVASVFKMSATGGTSFDEPMVEAVKTIETQSVFSRADITFITDGHGSFSSHKYVDSARKRLGFKTHGLVISDSGIPAQRRESRLPFCDHVHVASSQGVQADLKERHKKRNPTPPMSAEQLFEEEVKESMKELGDVISSM